MTSTVTERGASPSHSTTPSYPIWQAGAIAAVVGAVAAVVFAVVAKAIDIPMEADGEEIPTAGFGIVTAGWSVVGIGIAYAFARWAKRPARTFVVTTVVLTVLSFGPVLGADATTATQVALVLSHALAAAIVIPAIALRLPKSNRP